MGQNSDNVHQHEHPEDHGKQSRLDQKKGLAGLANPGGMLELFDIHKADFSFDLRKGEKQVVERIEEHIEEYVGEHFRNADRIMARFYGAARGLDPETGEMGDTTEWNQLTGQDYEMAIWGLQQVITEVGKLVSRLKTRANFAYQDWDNKYYAHYREPIEGTINDRIAHARRKTAEERFMYFVTFTYYDTVHNRWKQLIEQKKTLEFSSQRALKRETNFRY